MQLLLELKTTSEDCSPGSIYWKRLTLDNQVSMYLSAARDMGHDVTGVLYDVIRKTGLRPLGKGTETAASYEQRIISQIAEDPDRYFTRGVIVRTTEEIAEHDADVWQIADLIRLARNADRWPRHVGSCVMYGSTCDYWGVCAEGVDIDGSHFETRPQMNDRTAPVKVGEHELAPSSPTSPTSLTTPPTPTDNKKRLPVLSTSALATWRACPRKYYFAYELRRRRVGDDRKPLWFGKLIHKAIEAYNTRLGRFNVRDVNHALDLALRICGEAKEEHEAAHARALVRGYHARWADAPLRFLASEKPFLRPLRNPDTGAASRTFELGGVVDAIVEEMAPS